METIEYIITTQIVFMLYFFREYNKPANGNINVITYVLSTGCRKFDFELFWRGIITGLQKSRKSS